jgi:F0F1-type ATP synthase membrane subunit c/vacuolar-type H+-ATPase subunit K
VLALAVIGLLLLSPGQPRLPLAWLGLPGLLLVVELITNIFRIRTSVSPGVDYVPFILLAGAALWSVVDARPMTAVAMWIALGLGTDSVSVLTRNAGFRFDGVIVAWVWESLALVGLAVAIIGIWQFRRQAVF